MNHPYRSAEAVPEAKPKAPGVEPLTPGELAFWESAYCAAMQDPCPPKKTCAERADIAVARRRERFGVR